MVQWGENWRLDLGCSTKCTWSSAGKIPTRGSVTCRGGLACEHGCTWLLWLPIWGFWFGSGGSRLRKAGITMCNNFFCCVHVLELKRAIGCFELFESGLRTSNAMEEIERSCSLFMYQYKWTKEQYEYLASVTFVTFILYIYFRIDRI